MGDEWAAKVGQGRGWLPSVGNSALAAEVEWNWHRRGRHAPGATGRRSCLVRSGVLRRRQLVQTDDPLPSSHRHLAAQQQHSQVI